MTWCSKAWRSVASAGYQDFRQLDVERSNVPSFAAVFRKLEFSSPCPIGSYLFDARTVIRAIADVLLGYESPALAALASMDRLAHEVRKWLRQQALKDFREAVTGADRTDGELPALTRRVRWMTRW